MLKLICLTETVSLKMTIFEFNVSTKYKKSFVEYSTLKKVIDNKTVNVTRELVWRTGEFQVTITEDEFQKYCKDCNLNFSTIEGNEIRFFESMQKDDVLTFDESFPFQHEFLSSFDGCSDDYTISYDDGSDVEESIRDEIDSVLEDGDFYDLEDEHEYYMDDTKYEIHGELEIERI